MAQEVFRFRAIKEYTENDKKPFSELIKKHILVGEGRYPSTLLAAIITKVLPGNITNTSLNTIQIELNQFVTTGQKVTSISNLDVNDPVKTFSRIVDCVYSNNTLPDLQAAFIKNKINIDQYITSNIAPLNKRITDNIIYYTLSTDEAPSDLTKALYTIEILAQIKNNVDIKQTLRKKLVLTPLIIPYIEITSNRAYPTEKNALGGLDLMSLMLASIPDGMEDVLDTYKMVRYEKTIKELGSIKTEFTEKKETINRRGERSEKFFIKTGTLVNLSKDVQLTIAELKIDIQAVEINDIIKAVEYQFKRNRIRGGVTETALIHNKYIKIGKYTKPLFLRNNTRRKYVKVLGTEEYFVVKQLWDRYEKGEIAHVENILKGEGKVRKHIIQDETETETQTFSESIERTDRELETTSRFELQSEASSIANSDQSFEAGISAKYKGPGVEVSGNVKYGRNSSEETTLNTATNYAKEITEKAVNNLQKTVRESNRIKIIHKVTEENTHTLQGGIDTHTIGIYRWVDKVYKVWKTSIGIRKIVEFIIPEPAMYYIYSKTQEAKNGGNTNFNVQQFQILDNGSFRDIRPEDIEEENYIELATKFNIKDIPLPPAKTKIISVNLDEINSQKSELQKTIKVKDTDEDDGTENSKKEYYVLARNLSKEIKVPSGYIPFSIKGNAVGNFSKTSIMNALFAPPQNDISGYDGVKYFYRREFERLNISINGTNLPIPIPMEIGKTGATILAESPSDPLKDRINKDAYSLSQERYTINGNLLSLVYKDPTERFELDGVTVGTTTTSITGDFDKVPFFPIDKDIEALALSVSTRGIDTISGNVQIEFKITEKLMISWKMKVYEKIMAAYYELKNDADEKAAQQRVREGVQIRGNNPLYNKEIIETEIKKHCIELLRERDYTDFDGIKADSEKEPVMDYTQIVDEGKIIQFFEQAFEWNYIAYKLYPYFWSRPSDWKEKMSFKDPDPLFNKFLNSGAVRVVVPIREGYNDIVDFFISSGKIWENSPVIGDEIYMSIAEELAEDTKKDSDIIPTTGTWELKLPTSLVSLDNESDVEQMKNPKTNVI